MAQEMTKDEALSKIESLDGYFIDCEEIGQGINSKETCWMLDAMNVAIDAGVSPLTIDSMTISPTSKSILARTPVMQGMRELFGV